MKRFLLLCIFGLAEIALFAQTNAMELAPGAKEQLKTLLNNPRLAKPVMVTSLGRNWFRLEMDAHIFTDQVSVQQVAAVLLDVNNQEKYFDGKRSKLIGKVVSQGEGETIADFISISIAPLGIKIRTPYRVAVTTPENTGSKFSLKMEQTALDSASNRDIKNFLAVRYAEAVIIDGISYTYIRMYTIDDANASILPGAQGILEKNSGPANIEALELLIAAAKNKGD